MPGCLQRQQLFPWLRLTPQSLILRDRHPINVISQHYPAPELPPILSRDSFPRVAVVASPIHPTCCIGSSLQLNDDRPSFLNPEPVVSFGQCGACQPPFAYLEPLALTSSWEAHQSAKLP